MDYSKFRLRCFTRLEPYYDLLCGSNYELPIKSISYYLSDMDIMHYCFDICAIPWNRNPPKNTRCTILRIDSTETPSGYARLKIQGDGIEKKPSYYRRPRTLAKVESGGPSIQSVGNYGYTVWKQYTLKPCRDYVSTDQVFAIYCPYWPVEAEEWRNRKRFHGWPNEKLIARITRGGCHFVSKLRTWSSSDDTEWRFSFSKAELILIHSWTNVQKHVYHVIRCLKKFVVRHCGGDGDKGLQTYYFKTLMLWACEEFPPEFWSEQNINTCIETLFLRFLRCLENKYCPSYFIPRCNIMGHLEDEIRFDKELETIQELLAIGEVSRFSGLFTRYPRRDVFCFRGSFEHLCLQFTTLSFPINGHLNGRFGEYLSECEWFLPGMKNLHTAVEANLRLMSLGNVTSRKESRDYVECVEQLKCALIINEDFESFKYPNQELSHYELVNATLLRRQTRNSIPIYRRSLRKSFEDDATEQMVKESVPSAIHCTVSAYRANFHFTAMQSYKESLNECERCLDIMNKVNVSLNYHNSYIPVLICNSLSQIYDEYLQVILGFVTLQRNIFSSGSSNSSTAHEVCLKVDAKEFLKYLYIQCEHKLSFKPERFDCFYASNSALESTCMSQIQRYDVCSAVSLFAALRLSRVCRTPLKGHLIPLSCRYSSNIPAI